jgi:hypothetical protein
MNGLASEAERKAEALKLIALRVQHPALIRRASLRGAVLAGA